jgi:hypothetical protein
VFQSSCIDLNPDSGWTTCIRTTFLFDELNGAFFRFRIYIWIIRLVIRNELLASFVMLLKEILQSVTKSRAQRSALRLLPLSVTYKTGIDQTVN